MTKEVSVEMAFRAIHDSAFYTDTDMAVNIVYLMTDLMHLAVEQGVDPEAVVRMATYHFEAEK
jgi:hypothetical protein